MESLVAAGAAILGVLLGGLVSFLIANSQQKAAAANLESQQRAAAHSLAQELDAAREAQRRDARIRFRQRQLTELYGPLFLERRRSEHLRARLPEWEDQPGGERWRLVDHIAEVRADPDLRPFGDAVLESGRKVVELLRGLGGLLEPFPPYEAFSKFVLHHEMLTMSWEAGEDQDPDRRFPFPGGPPSGRAGDCTAETARDDLDCAILLGMRAVQTDLEKLLALPAGALAMPDPFPTGEESSASG